MKMTALFRRWIALVLMALVLEGWAWADVTTIIPRGSTWRYLDNGSNQGTAWSNLEFNDSSWKTGRAQLGYGDGDEATVVGYGPDANNKYITTYFRSTFTLTNAPQFTNLLMRLLRDDGAVAYLNGTEVARQNMPPGTITYTSRASISIPPADEVTFFPATIDPVLLRNGTNVIAVEVHQNGPQTSDLSFDLELIGYFTTNQTPPRVNLSSPAGGEYFYSASNILLRAEAASAAGSISQVEFRSGTTLVGTASASPFEFLWRDAPPGLHILTAQATDSLGLVGTSAPVTIYVLGNNDPWPVIIPSGAVWRYLDTGTDAGTAWRTLDFDDSTWKTGRAQLGYGDGDETTVVGYGPDPNNKYVTTYFRHRFTLADGAVYTNLYLQLLRDDGAVVYLNGEEVFRSNMGSGAVGFSTLAPGTVGGADETTYHDRRINPERLRFGANVLAVEVHQNAADSSDVSFDLELSGNVPGPDTSFSLAADERGLIRCLAHPDVAYDLYLPPAYSSDGAALPLVYTFHANGGGMVGDFQTVARILQVIVLGIMESQNGIDWPEYIDVLHAVTRDARQRINYDPTAVYAAGWSGGSVASYDFSKFCRQELAGVFAMSGWLEFRTNSVDRYLTNLLVARANGNTDTAANYYLESDGAHLLRYGVVLRDWSFSGGHVISPDSVKVQCLNWLISQRVPPGPNDQADAEAAGAAWRISLGNGERERVFRECLDALMTQPRTYLAREALLLLDELGASFPQFRRLDLSGAASGDYALDHFYFRAFGAAKAGDMDPYFSWLKAATGVTATSGDRLEHFRDLLRSFGLPRPLIRRLEKAPDSSYVLTFEKDALGADYDLEESPQLEPGSWAPADATPTGNPDGTWSALLPPSGSIQRFYRVRATIP